DVFRTVLAALGVDSRKIGNGRDLNGIASGLTPIALDPSVATSGERFIARWGSYTLSIRPSGDTFFCDVTLDPTCTYDREPLFPLATEAMFRAFAHERAHAPAPPDPVTAVLNDDSVSALRVWGAMD